MCKHVILNVGSWRDPVVSADPETYTIAVEALLKTAQAIKPHPRLFVITAAVADEVGLAPFFAYGDGVPGSSSLSQAKGSWAGHLDRDVPPVTYVPLITLRMLIEAIPDNITIILLKTDAQGWDNLVLRSAGDVIARAMSIQCEVMCARNEQYAEAPENSWRLINQFLEPHGFVDSEGDKCVKGTANSYHDAFFTRANDCRGPYCSRQSVEIHTF